MNRFLLMFMHLVCVMPLSASDYGTTGLIDIPTARMSSDGTLTATAAIQSRNSAYALTYQVTPWLEGTFRYTGMNEFFFYDRNYEGKIRLLQEGDYTPQLAIGIRDMVGTAFFGSEYLVASKKVGDFDFTVGLGWGRLAGDGDLSNPLIQLSPRFESRSAASACTTCGASTFSSWFSGEQVGFFGGMSYELDSLPVTLMLEYNPDLYTNEIEQALSLFGPRDVSPLSVALKWQVMPGVALSLSRQHKDEWGFELSAALDSKSPPVRRASPKFKSSLDMAPQDLPAQINPQDWYDMLLFDAERSGLLLLESSIEPISQTATLVMGNEKYPLWADAIAKTVALADLHLPASVNTFRIVVDEAGHRVHTIQMPRPSSGYAMTGEIFERQIKILSGRKLAVPQNKTNFAQKKAFFDVGLSSRFQLFDPDDPARYQVYTKVGATLALPQSWTLTGTYSFDISNNFDESQRLDSGSALERVRSENVRYLIEGDTGLEALYLEKRGTAFKRVHYRAFGGVLEEMYSGLGGEVLYQPFQSRLAFGLSGNWLRQRYYDRSFKHLDYQTITAFASIYWASPFYNLDAAVHAGKYLAKDKGATFEVRRTFSNGWMVGLFATFTDVSAADFGEGSFDKGMFFKIPFDGLFGRNTRGHFATRIRPIQRDGGQRLEDFSSNIWWDIRDARYDAFSGLTDRMVP